MYGIGYLVAWRDKMNAVPKLEDTPNAGRLEGISERDLRRIPCLLRAGKSPGIIKILVINVS